MPTPKNQLTNVQREAVKFVASGAKNRLICERLDISESSLIRWKRRGDFRQAVNDLIVGEANEKASQLSQQFEQYSLELLENARADEELLMVQLREILERFVKILETRLDSLSESEITELPIRLIPSFFSSFTDGASSLQAAHDRLTGYGLLVKELGGILEKSSTATDAD